MKKISYKITILFFIIFTLITSAEIVRSQELSKILEGEYFLGDPNAPITVVEYASMSCPHCAAFHINTLPIIKGHMDVF